ncbi:MAG: hypothetical protein ABSG33_04060 [Candidatus Bathyarchaeia archaeon]|jgi:hypothetical protein
MSKEKLEKDYQNFSLQIEKMAEEEVKSIKEKADAIKAEVTKIGEAVEGSLKGSEAKEERKKVNS